MADDPDRQNLRRDSVLPLLRMSSICDSANRAEGAKPEGYMVVVKAGDKLLAVAVDALREQQEVVVKTLGKQVSQSEVVAGASILGDGQVVLILDVASLAKAATQASRGVAQVEKKVSLRAIDGGPELEMKAA